MCLFDCLCVVLLCVFVCERRPVCSCLLCLCLGFGLGCFSLVLLYDVIVLCVIAMCAFVCLFSIVVCVSYIGSFLSCCVCVCRFACLP